jgi:preprotein translocase subunit SecE
MRSIWSGVKRWTSGLFSRDRTDSRGRTESSGEKDLRERLSARIEAEKRKARSAEALRKELGEMQSKMDSVESRARALERRMRELNGGQERLETALSEDLEVVEQVGQEMAEAAEMGKRVAKTFQRAEEDLKTMHRIGDQIRSLEEDFRGVIKKVSWVEWRGVARSIGIVTAGILAAILILWTSQTLSLWVVPVELRVSSTELRKIQRQERVDRAAQALDSADTAKLRDLLEKGEKRAQSRQKELSAALGLSKGVGPRGGEQPEER